MGVLGLTTFYKENGPEVSDTFDLVQEASRRGGLELVVDFSSFLVLACVESTHVHFRHIEHSWFHICHAGYDIFRNFVANMIGKLRKSGIELVFFTDGACGSDMENFERKLETWKERRHSRTAIVTHLKDYCRGHEASKGQSLIPPLLDLQMCQTLKEAHCKVFHNRGEADVAIAKYLATNEKAFAVLGNDSDFCVMKDCRFIPEPWFDLKNELHSVEADLQHLEVRVITPDKVAAALELESHEELVELAILKGCDFTKPYLHQYLKVGLRRLHMEELALWFIENIRPVGSRLEGYKPLKNHLKSNPELEKAIKFSRDFYNLRTEEKTPSSALEHYLDASVRSSQLPGEVLSWYNSVHMAYSLLEDLSLGKPAISPALQDLRRYMYTLVKERGHVTVTEYGRTSTENFHVVEVATVEFKNCPLADQIGDLSPEKRRRLFDMIASHMECPVPSTFKRRLLKDQMHVHPYFKTIGPRQEFLYYVINYLLCLSEHKERRLDLSREELLVVTAMAFREESHTPVRFENVRPSIRCFTVSSWFQETFRHFVQLARILRIDDDIPQPYNVFLGRHFVALFMEVEKTVEQGSSLPTFDDNALRHFTDIVNSNRLVTEKRKKFLLEVVRQSETAVLSSENPPLPPAEPRAPPPHEAFSLEADDEDSCHIPQVLREGADEGEPIVDASPAAYVQDLDTPKAAEGVVPILAFKDKILDHVKNHRITCIQGETGCGKSTKVPQFILEDYGRNPQSYTRKLNIIVTQPRRIAAKSLAERVAREQQTTVGDKVGYKIGQDYCADRNTQLLFVTTGYFLQLLVTNPKAFENFSHIILDEIHERDLDSDLASLVVKLLAKENIKLIIMSATLQGDMFLRYFASHEELQAMSTRTLFVGAKRFPVEEIYLEDLCFHFGHKLDTSLKLKILEGIKCFNLKDLKAQGKDHRIRVLIEELLKTGVLQKAQLLSKPASSWRPESRRELCANVIRVCATPGEAILVFLPGEQSIDNLFETLVPFENRRGPDWKCLIRLFVLHSKIPFQEQMDVFSVPVAGRAHVILATNIAESSLTVPNVRVVIDYGQRKQLSYDTKRRVNVLKLEWCSKASLDQRKGRTGRVFEGKCVRLFTKSFQSKLPDFDMPQMQVAPLDELFLRIKHLGRVIAPDSKPSELLSQAIEPPRIENIHEAIETLADMGAIEHADEMARVTLLGSIARVLPSDLRLCRLVLYGVLFSCPCDAIVIAAALQSVDPFSMPTKKIIKDDVQFSKALSHTTASRAKFDDAKYSEPIMLRNLVKGWLIYANRILNRDTPLPLADIRRRFCQDNALNYSRFLSMEALAWDIAKSVERMLDRDSPALSDVKSLLAAFPTKRRKGAGVYVPAQRDHPPKDPDIASLFVKDMKKLNFVFAAAFNPAILLGTSLEKGLQLRAKTVETNEKLVQDMEKASVDPKLAICIPKIPEIFHYDTEHLSDVLKRIAPPKKLEVVSTDRVFLEYKWIGLAARRTRTVNDVPPGAHALSQFGEGRKSFPVQLLKLSSSTVDEDGKACVQMKQPIQPHQINWSLMSIGGAPLMSCKKACKPRFEWKNPIGFACETEGIDHYAVGCKFTAYGGSGWIYGVSVLPSDCDNLISLLSILAFQPKQFGAKFKVSSKEKRILSVELFGHECKFSAKHPLTTQLLQILNEVRLAISDAFANEPTSHRGIPNLDLSPLMETLFSAAERPPAVPGHRKEQAPGRRTVMPILGPEPLEMHNKFTVLPLVDETSNDEEVSKSEKDEACESGVIFTVSAFYPEPEGPDLPHDQGDAFVLLEPYNDRVLEEDFIASRRKKRCKAVEDSGIKTMIESFPDSDSGGDEAVPIVEILYPSLESTLGEELLKKAPEPVPLTQLGCAPKAREIIESCEHHLGTLFSLKDFLVGRSALFQRDAQQDGSFEVSLTPAGEHKFRSQLNAVLAEKDNECAKLSSRCESANRPETNLSHGVDPSATSFIDDTSHESGLPQEDADGRERQFFPSVAEQGVMIPLADAHGGRDEIDGEGMNDAPVDSAQINKESILSDASGSHGSRKLLPAAKEECRQEVIFQSASPVYVPSTEGRPIIPPLKADFVENLDSGFQHGPTGDVGNPEGAAGINGEEAEQPRPSDDHTIHLVGYADETLPDSNAPQGRRTPEMIERTCGALASDGNSETRLYPGKALEPRLIPQLPLSDGESCPSTEEPAVVDHDQASVRKRSGEPATVSDREQHGSEIFVQSPSIRPLLHKLRGSAQALRKMATSTAAEAANVADLASEFLKAFVSLGVRQDVSSCNEEAVMTTTRNPSSCSRGDHASINSLDDRQILGRGSLGDVSMDLKAGNSPESPEIAAVTRETLQGLEKQLFESISSLLQKGRGLGLLSEVADDPEIRTITNLIKPTGCPKFDWQEFVTKFSSQLEIVDRDEKGGLWMRLTEEARAEPGCSYSSASFEPTIANLASGTPKVAAASELEGSDTSTKDSDETLVAGSETESDGSSLLSVDATPETAPSIHPGRPAASAPQSEAIVSSEVLVNELEERLLDFVCVFLQGKQGPESLYKIAALPQIRNVIGKIQAISGTKFEWLPTFQRFPTKFKLRNAEETKAVWHSGNVNMERLNEAHVADLVCSQVGGTPEMNTGTNQGTSHTHDPEVTRQLEEDLVELLCERLASSTEAPLSLSCIVGHPPIRAVVNRLRHGRGNQCFRWRAFLPKYGDYFEIHRAEHGRGTRLSLRQSAELSLHRHYHVCLDASDASCVLVYRAPARDTNSDPANRVPSESHFASPDVVDVPRRDELSLSDGSVLPESHSAASPDQPHLLDDSVPPESNSTAYQNQVDVPRRDEPYLLDDSVPPESHSTASQNQVDVPRRDEPYLLDDSVPLESHSRASPNQVDVPSRDEPPLLDDSVPPESHSTASPNQVDVPSRDEPSLLDDSVPPESHSTASLNQVDVPSRDEPSLLDDSVPPESHFAASPNQVDVPRTGEPSLSDDSVLPESRSTAPPNKVDVPRRDEASLSDEQNTSRAEQYNVPCSSDTQCQSDQLENNLVELLSEYLAQSPHEQQLMARVGSHPPIKAVVQQLRQRERTPFKWKSFLLKHRDRFLVKSDFESGGEQLVKLRSPEESQACPGDKVENTLCSLSGAERNFLELLSDLGKGAVPLSEAIQTLLDEHDLPAPMHGTTAGVAPSHRGSATSQAWVAGVNEKRRDSEDAEPEVKEKPGTDAGNIAKLEEEICSILVERLQKGDNTPIRVSEAANDEELKPLIRQLRQIPSGRFKWIRFLTQRENIFEIRDPDTLNFQFCLRGTKHTETLPVAQPSLDEVEAHVERTEVTGDADCSSASDTSGTVSEDDSTSEEREGSSGTENAPTSPPAFNNVTPEAQTSHASSLKTRICDILVERLQETNNEGILVSAAAHDGELGSFIQKILALPSGSFTWKKFLTVRKDIFEISFEQTPFFQFRLTKEAMAAFSENRTTFSQCSGSALQPSQGSNAMASCSQAPIEQLEVRLMEADAAPEVKEKPVTDARTVAKLEEEICSIVVARLHKRGNTPIPVSEAANDEELKPLIKHIRELPSGHFRWIQFLTERETFFEISNAQTPFFQFCLTKETLAAFSESRTTFSQCSGSALQPSQGSNAMASCSQAPIEQLEVRLMEADAAPEVKEKPVTDARTVAKLEEEICSIVVARLHKRGNTPIPVSEAANDEELKPLIKHIRELPSGHFRWIQFLTERETFFEISNAQTPFFQFCLTKETLAAFSESRTTFSQCSGSALQPSQGSNAMASCSQAPIEQLEVRLMEADAAPEVKEKPVTDARTVAKLEEEICSIVVARLHKRGNTPIPVSEAANDEELKPLIKHIRKLPSGHFRWIQFLTERETFFEISNAQTPFFQFCLTKETLAAFSESRTTFRQCSDSALQPSQGSNATASCSQAFLQQLEVRLLEAVCCAVEKRQVLARVASDPKIQKITKTIKNTTGSKFRWMPFLEKHSANVKTMMLNGGHWLSLTEAAEPLVRPIDWPSF